MRVRFDPPEPGGVAERSKAPVLKIGRAQALVGSNPTPSASTSRSYALDPPGSPESPSAVFPNASPTREPTRFATSSRSLSFVMLYRSKIERVLWPRISIATRAAVPVRI